jgi:hypothetical protein
VAYEVRVPRSADLTGTYWSLLMIEPEAALGGTGPTKPGEVGVRTILRYAVHLSTQIGNTGTCDMRFSDKRLVRDEHGLALQLDIENTGERLLTLHVWADVYDAQGAKVARLTAEPARVNPTCATRVRLDLGSLTKGEYNVLMVADNGDEHVFGTRLQLDTR